MIVFTDWEGPWVLTDFAYECAAAFLNNPSFFERLSQYDDYLAFVKRKEDYCVGDSLKLLAPFLVATDVTSKDLYMLSEKVVQFIPDCKYVSKSFTSKYRVVVVSSAYHVFLNVSTSLIEFNAEIWATKFVPEFYKINDKDKSEIIKAIDIIANLPKIEIKNGEIQDDRSKKSIRWLDNFFWNYLVNSSAGNILKEVKAIGGKRKKEIIRKYVEENNVQDPIFIGDSISDSEALKWVKEIGFAISFNGNKFAVKNSNIAVISDSAYAHIILIDTIARFGFKGVKMLSQGDYGFLNDKLRDIAKKILIEVYLTDEIDINMLISKSEKIRRKLRGIAGSLT